MGTVLKTGKKDHAQAFGRPFALGPLQLCPLLAEINCALTRLLSYIYSQVLHDWCRCSTNGHINEIQLRDAIEKSQFIQKYMFLILILIYK